MLSHHFWSKYESSIHNIKMLIDGLEWCGLLWCFYQLFGLSFWRHPFTAEHPLLSKWWNATFLQIRSYEETLSKWVWGGIYICINVILLTLTICTFFPCRCWILDSDVHYYVNIGYYCLVFIFTFSTFIVVLRWLSMLKLNRLNKVEKVQHSRTATMDITTVLGLCCMLGLSWSFAFFSYGDMRLPSYYIFTILNSSQGESMPADEFKCICLSYDQRLGMH